MSTIFWRLHKIKTIKKRTAFIRLPFRFCTSGCVSERQCIFRHPHPFPYVSLSFRYLSVNLSFSCPFTIKYTQSAMFAA